MTTPTNGYSFFDKEVSALRTAVERNQPSHSREIVQNDMQRLAAEHLAELTAMMGAGTCSITSCSKSIADMFSVNKKAPSRSV